MSALPVLMAVSLHAHITLRVRGVILALVMLHLWAGGRVLSVLLVTFLFFASCAKISWWSHAPKFVLGTPAGFVAQGSQSHVPRCKSPPSIDRAVAAALAAALWISSTRTKEQLSFLHPLLFSFMLVSKSEVWATLQTWTSANAGANVNTRQVAVTWCVSALQIGLIVFFTVRIKFESACYVLSQRVGCRMRQHLSST